MIKIHFLNVGHGDCTIIEHANRNITMIDINNGSGIDDDSFKHIVETLAPERCAALMIKHAAGYDEDTLLAEAGYDIQLANPVAYFKEAFPGRSIFRYIQSHPDCDHLRGLVGLNDEGISITNFWDTTHTKKLDPEKTF